MPVDTRPGRRPALLYAVAVAALLALAGLFVLAERRHAGRDRIEIAGGGFLYNYRIGEIRYDIVVRLVRPMPIGTRLEVAFGDPAGGAPIIVSRSLGTGTSRVGVESPAVSGLKKGDQYQVVVRLRDRDTGAVMETHERTFRVAVDPAVMPEQPLTTGPGYHRNPEAQ